jgi:hypothetical protein
VAHCSFKLTWILIGVGLIEIVTLPELHSPDEAMALMEQLRLYLVHNKICMGDLFSKLIGLYNVNERDF